MDGKELLSREINLKEIGLLIKRGKFDVIQVSVERDYNSYLWFKRIEAELFLGDGIIVKIEKCW